MSELALNDDQRDALARHLDGVGVAELVRRESSADAAVWRSCSRVAAGDQPRPRVGPVRMQNSGPTGSATRNSNHC